MSPFTYSIQQPPEESTPRLILLHALTGCDTSCFICGHSKKLPFVDTSCFFKHQELLSGLGEGELIELSISKQP